MTPLQRPADLADREFLTLEELAVRQGVVAERSSLDNRPRTETGAYNEFWMERGSLNRRTSLVIDPPNGRLPALTGPEQDRQSRRTDSYIATRFDSWLDFNKLDRCITRGLPGAMMPGFYNHNYQIVQTEDYLVILVEMIHDARIIPLDGRAHLAPELQQWLGDSRGHWDGDTLVIETTNFNDKILGRGGTVFGGSEHLRVVERLTRVDAVTIDYEITVTDPPCGPSRGRFPCPWRRWSRPCSSTRATRATTRCRTSCRAHAPRSGRPRASSSNSNSNSSRGFARGPGGPLESGSRHDAAGSRGGSRCSTDLSRSDGCWRRWPSPACC